MSTLLRHIKDRKSLGATLSVFVIILAVIAGNHYYVNNIKYKNLEQVLLSIHAEMRANLPQNDWDNMEHFGVGSSIRSHYNLWDENSEIRQLFEKNGIHHPDNMSSLIMETFVRANRKIPLRLHRLIELQSAAYESEDKEKALFRLAEEFFIYEKYREELRRTKQ